MTEEKNSDEKISEEAKKLVIARIDAQLPSNLKLSIGSKGSLDKKEMIKHIQAGDEQGKQIVDMHMNFIQALTSGELIKQVNSV